MKNSNAYIFGVLVSMTMLFMGCGSSSGGYSSGYRSTNHYYHGHAGWGHSYYHGGGPVIIVDDRPDIPDIPDVPDFGPPEAVQLPDMDW